MKQHNRKLNNAITMIIGGSALMVGSASATVTTMYNMTTAAGLDTYTESTQSAQPINQINPSSGGSWGYQLGGTDGWVHGFNSAPNGTDTSVAKWVGTSAQNKTPFGYMGSHLNWAIEMTGGNGGSGVISTFDAFDRYGVYADIDTAKGAWSDNVSGNTGEAGGWRHDLDMGLFRSDVSGKVTLEIKAVIDSNNTDFGFTVFKGQNTNGGSYLHHGTWNSTTNNFGVSVLSLPGGNTSFQDSDIVAHSVGDPATNIGSIMFDAEAGQVYTIAVGGYRTGSWSETRDGYELTVTQEPVRVPAAQVPMPHWALVMLAIALFGTAIRSTKTTPNS